MQEDDQRWMALALDQARHAAESGEVPVGAVVVKDGQLLASGCNAPIAGHDPTAHAEIVALREAARVLGNYRLDGCTLYVTLEPCPMCSGAMLHARLARVVYGAADPRTGAAGSVLDLFAQPQLNHQTQVTGGVCADACGQLLKDFFKPRRINAEPLREDALRTPDKAFAGLPMLPGTACSVQDLPVLAGLRLNYVDSDPDGAGEATLWVHGPQAWSLAWLGALGAAPAGRHILPDLIGFGRSDKPKKDTFHTLSMHAAILHGLCDRLGLQRVQVVGPADVQPLLRALHALDSQRYAPPQVVPMVLLDTAARQAPFPDKGYLAGPRALAQALQASCD